MTTPDVAESAKALLEALRPLLPMYDNGFLDSVVWPVFRRTGDHRNAEELTRLTNDVRAAQRQLMDSLGLDNPSYSKPEAQVGTEIIDLDGRQWTVTRVVECRGSRWYEVRNDSGTAVRYDSDIAGVELKGSK